MRVGLRVSIAYCRRIAILIRKCQQSFAKLPPVTLRENPFPYCSMTRTTEANRCVLHLLAVYTPKQNSKIRSAFLSVAKMGFFYIPCR